MKPYGLENAEPTALPTPCVATVEGATTSWLLSLIYNSRRTATKPPPPIHLSFSTLLNSSTKSVHALLCYTLYTESKFRKGKDDNCVPDIEERIKTEEKAAAVALVWGEEFIQYLAAPAVLRWTI